MLLQAFCACRAALQAGRSTDNSTAGQVRCRICLCVLCEAWLIALASAGING